MNISPNSAQGANFATGANSTSPVRALFNSFKGEFPASGVRSAKVSAQTPEQSLANLRRDVLPN